MRIKIQKTYYCHPHPHHCSPLILPALLIVLSLTHGLLELPHDNRASSILRYDNASHFLIPLLSLVTSCLMQLTSLFHGMSHMVVVVFISQQTVYIPWFQLGEPQLELTCNTTSSLPRFDPQSIPRPWVSSSVIVHSQRVLTWSSQLFTTVFGLCRLMTFAVLISYGLVWLWSFPVKTSTGLTSGRGAAARHQAPRKAAKDDDEGGNIARNPPTKSW